MLFEVFDKIANSRSVPLSKKSSPKLSLRIVFASILLTISVFIAAPMQAQAEPATFKRPRGSFMLGIDVFKPVMGDFGKYSRVGLSVFGEAILQAGYFGAAVRFGSGRGFTKKNFLPFDEGYQFVYLTAGPRFYYPPFRRLHLYFYMQPEVSLQVYQSNTLVKISGNESLRGSAGASVGTTFISGIIHVQGQVSVQYVWGLKTLLISGGLSVGLSANF